MDPRHLKRIETVQNLFAISFEARQKSLPFPKNDKTSKILKHLKKIDGLIRTYAKKFPIDKIAKTDLAILRMSVYDLVIENKLPAKVVINEAVELSKELSGEKAYGFVNAILGNILGALDKKI